jgi:hypothetical protein
MSRTEGAIMPVIDASRIPAELLAARAEQAS